MTRTALAPDLNLHIPEPYVEIHPEDAVATGLRDGMLAEVRSARGAAVAVVKVSDRQRRGALFLPMHWTEVHAPQGRSNGLIGPERDAASGQPEFKHTPAAIAAWGDTWRGFCISRTRLDPPAGLDIVWRRSPRAGFQLHEFAGRGDRGERERMVRALSRDGSVAAGDLVSLDYDAIGAYRRAWMFGARAERILFITAAKLPPRDWLMSLFERDEISIEDRAALLVGRPAGPIEEKGPQVCACLRVGAVAIRAARAAGAATVDAIGAATGAGTNCGSCRSEIARLIATLETAHAA